MHPYAYLAGNTCPTCDRLMPFVTLFGRYDRVHTCKHCSAQSKLPAFKAKYLAVILPVFFGAFLLGAALVSHIDALSITFAGRERAEPNFAGALLIGIFFVAPCVALTCRALGLKLRPL